MVQQQTLRVYEKFVIQFCYFLHKRHIFIMKPGWDDENEIVTGFACDAANLTVHPIALSLRPTELVTAARPLSARLQKQRWGFIMAASWWLIGPWTKLVTTNLLNMHKRLVSTESDRRLVKSRSHTAYDRGATSSQIKNDITESLQKSKWGLIMVDRW